jgi:phage tail sheath protein FI
MGFQVSPGVNVSEVDLTTIIPAVSTTTGAFAGHFRWGPVGQRVLLDSEITLVKNFNEPLANTYIDFFTAANFLAYGNALYTVRVVNEAGVKTTDTSRARNAISNAANTQNTIIKNEDDYNDNYSSGISGAGNWTAKYPGVLGNSLKISVCASANAYENTLTGTCSFANDSTTVSFTTASGNAGKCSVGDLIVIGPDRFVGKIAAVGSNTVTLASKYVGNTGTQSTTTRRWEYFDYVASSPGTSVDAASQGSSNDEVHIVVVDEDGQITGTQNSILEVFPALSKASGVKSESGTDIFYRTYVNKISRYIWWTRYFLGGNIGKFYNSGVNYSAGAGYDKPISNSLALGRDGAIPRAADYINGYNLFRNAEQVDVSLILGGGCGGTSTIPLHIINNIAEYRKDCIAVFSPRQTDVVNNSGYSGSEIDDIVDFRNSLGSTSYAVLDSGWKQQYDKYRDLFTYVPCNGDTAGTMVRTDIERDPWWSPAGYNRGQIKNVMKLAYNPGKTDRDQLYKRGINPIVTFPGEGTILFGDKTLLTKPSAFDRINVRRLFIVLEKAIATAAKYTLFEFNDAFTRAQFKAMVEPFLRDVQGRRGITDFRVVCDETNNTPEVIDRNEFVGDIYIKPARSINFIQLNFVAVRTGVDFTEVVGKF